MSLQKVALGAEMLMISVGAQASSGTSTSASFTNMNPRDAGLISFYLEPLVQRVALMAAYSKLFLQQQITARS